MGNQVLIEKNEIKKTSNRVEIVLYLSDLEELNMDEVQDFTDRFGALTVTGPGPRPKNLPNSVKWHSYKAEDFRSSVWNRLLKQAEKEWVLFVETGETVCMHDLPSVSDIDINRWVPACITYSLNDKQKYYYQIRLVPRGIDNLFDGKNLPDCTRYITEQNIELSSHSIRIQSPGDPTHRIDPDQELSIQTFAPQLYLVQGERYFQKGKYVHAAAQYRKVLKLKRLLAFDRLGAVNGLTSCFAEQYKWPQALKLAQESLEAEPLQKIPYLIQFKIFQLNKQWEKAFEALQNYFEVIDFNTHASFDKAIGKQETLLELVDLAMKIGKKKQASNYSDLFFAQKNGSVDQTFLESALLLSVELLDYERAVFFFSKLFEGGFPNNLNTHQGNRLNEFMQMFMNNGWYEYVSDIYKQLLEHYPQNRDYKRRLIVAFSKSNKIEKARQLIVG